MNKQQTCGFLGWTAKEFDRNVADGFPARKRSSSRGHDWEVDSREAVAWVVDCEVGKARPRGRPAARPEPPPGWEAFKAAEAVDDPLEAAAVVTLLWLFYHLPRLTALVAADLGLGMDQLFRLSGALLFALDELCRQRLEHWPKDPDAAFPVPDAFEPVNWPWLAERAGEPDWRPPGYGLCWVPLTEEERALSVAKGEEEEARWAEEERVAAADA